MKCFFLYGQTYRLWASVSNRAEIRLLRRLFRATALYFSLQSPNQGALKRSRVRVPEAPPSISEEVLIFLGKFGADLLVSSLPGSWRAHNLTTSRLLRKLIRILACYAGFSALPCSVFGINSQNQWLFMCAIALDVGLNSPNQGVFTRWIACRSVRRFESMATA